MTKKTTFAGGSSPLAWTLLLLFVAQVFAPLTVHASGGGPTQPEVQGFTPIGVSDMVDPFTGDFTYNIPLMDVEGYPINIAYSSGISMDQEASWVGLGWSLNMGAVVRNMRGLPDDFKGDAVVKTTNLKPNTTIGLSAGANAEIFSFGLKSGEGSGGLSAQVAIDYNTYNGFSTGISVSPSFSFAKKGGARGTAGFSLSGSSENGASFSPSLSLSKTEKDRHGDNISLTNTIGASMNSRAGLREISFSRSMSQLYNKTVKQSDGTDKIIEKQRSGATSGSFDLGLSSYTPGSSSSMNTISLSGNVNIGTTIFGADGSLKLGINYSRTYIPDDLKTVTSQAFGYFNLSEGQRKAKALLDFNRDNDASFSKYTVNLPTAYLTSDLFSVQAQGTGGSFKAMRNDIGYVFDPLSTNQSVAGSLGLEFGLGGLLDFGGDVTYNNTNSYSGGWTDLNDAENMLRFKANTGLIRGYSFIEASESSVDQDALMGNQFYDSKPVFMPLGPGIILFSKLQSKVKNGSASTTLSSNARTQQRRANNQLYFLTHKELSDGLGTEAIDPDIYSGAQDHHIGEVTQLGMDGRRYVFGIAAYNHFQEDVTFAIGSTNYGGAVTSENDFGGLVGYSGTDAGPNNSKGIDNYYSSSLTPAYAHSFLLTSVLSDDYIDADAEKGPSEDDFGSYVKFSYDKVDNYQWRTPVNENEAYYNEGLKSNPSDDKASFVHGKKDLWYVTMVETKNYVAVLTLEDREDALSAAGRNGGLDDNKSMKRLQKISLYSRPEYEANPSTAVPIQEVHFEYSYELCDQYPGNDNGEGKLTLKEIWFSYQNSNKMKHRSYEFDYNGLPGQPGVNPDFDMRAVDRWGTYKPNAGSGVDYPTKPEMSNSDNPYTTQNKSLADQYASAWCLSEIKLPSGGKINVDYESDDYGYVQHKIADRMFRILGVENSPGLSSSLDGTTDLQTISSEIYKNNGFYFELENEDDPIELYGTPGTQVSYKVLMDFVPGMSASPAKGKCDYVTGYATVQTISKVTVGSHIVGYVKFYGEKLKDNDSPEYNPVTKAGILMGRMQMAGYINDAMPNGTDGSGGEQAIVDFANSVVGALASFKELVSGPNKVVYDAGKCRNIVTAKSFVRLHDPNRTKLGGGARVKRIRMNDNWQAMTGNHDENNFEYGQEYDYTLENGQSSGVASYEPQIGGEENSWHTAQIVNQQVRFATDNSIFLEYPIMESQFPSPQVGYSRVTIKNLQHDGVSRTATGKVVKEFYTARDFPTIVSKTGIDMRTANKMLPIGPSYNYLDASQGFTIELNDMHGKPKKESVYAENQTAPLSMVEYTYQSDVLNLDGVANNKLRNTASVIMPDGTTSTAELGVKYDAVADLRQDETNSYGGSMDLNSNTILFGFFPLVVPIALPKLNMAHNRFRSASVTKVVNRFGILEKTVANQDGSIVETRNLSYDSESGQVLTTRTTTNFNDQVYSLNFPAYWKYGMLGAAYKNIMYALTVPSITSGGQATISASQNNFAIGDEVSVSGAAFATPVRGWVIDKTPNGIKIIDKEGDPVSSGSEAKIKVIRSGYRNKQTTSMASLTALDNPQPGLVSNIYAKVLNAGAIEFSDDWKTYCDCFPINNTTSNPFILGTKGQWRPSKSFTHLTGRSQSNYDRNTNIRRDGVFTSFSPYYRNVAGQWDVSGQNWTYVSEVTAFSPNGMTLETKDALGRYSASRFAFNNTLTTAVAANTSMRELEFASFEDLDFSNCTDRNVFYNYPESVTETISHTGKRSLKVTAGNTLYFGNDEVCPPASASCSGLFTIEKAGIPVGTIPGYTFEMDVIYGDVLPVAGSDFLYSQSTEAYEVVYHVKYQGCTYHFRVTWSGSNLEDPTFEQTF